MKIYTSQIQFRLRKLLQSQTEMLVTQTDLFLSSIYTTPSLCHPFGSLKTHTLTWNFDLTCKNTNTHTTVRFGESAVAHIHAMSLARNMLRKYSYHSLLSISATAINTESKLKVMKTFPCNSDF